MAQRRRERRRQIKLPRERRGQSALGHGQLVRNLVAEATGVRLPDPAAARVDGELVFGGVASGRRQRRDGNFRLRRRLRLYPMVVYGAVARRHRLDRRRLAADVAQTLLLQAELQLLRFVEVVVPDRHEPRHVAGHEVARRLQASYYVLFYLERIRPPTEALPLVHRERHKAPRRDVIR